MYDFEIERDLYGIEMEGGTKVVRYLTYAWDYSDNEPGVMFEFIGCTVPVPDHPTACPRGLYDLPGMEHMWEVTTHYGDLVTYDEARETLRGWRRDYEFLRPSSICKDTPCGTYWC